MERTNLHLPRSNPEAQGISSAALTVFLNAIQERQLELHSLMLLRHGQVVAEGWWAPYAADIPHMMFSLSKSFTSTAIGLAVSEGKLSVEDTVVSFFPDDVPEEVNSNLSAMRIRHLLMMGTGHDKDTTSNLLQSEGGNWAKAFLHAPVDHVPGTHFVYNSGASYMLSAIIHKITGQNLVEYLQPRLFEPLGINGATWETCPRGISVGGWGLSVTTEDIAKLGQLYLQKGLWNGQRLLPGEWTLEATSKQISNGDGGVSDWAQGYGYQFWQCRHRVFRGDGAFSQFCIVMPEQDAVLAITGGTNDMQGVLDAVWDLLLPVMEPSPLSADRDSQAKLASELESLTIHPPKLQPQSSLEAAISGKEYKLDDNDQHLVSMTISFEDNKAVVVQSKSGDKYIFNLGRGDWVEGTTRLFGDEEKRVISSFTWKHEDTLELSIRYIEMPFSFTNVIQFVGDEIVWHHKSNVLSGQAEIRGRATELA